MNRLLLVVLALLLVALGWQTWRLADASRIISTQADELQSKSQALAKSNSQLISLSILTETNNREQARLYAEAEQTSALLRQRQRRIEELKRENEDLRHWADTPLPVDIIRLRDVWHSPEVQLTVSGCPRVTPCRLDQAAPRTNGDLNALLDETEAAWAVCADKVDMIIACQERNSEQTTIPAPRPQ